MSAVEREFHSCMREDVTMRYDLTGLGEQQFEDLSQALALAILGDGVSVFGDGPDGGREATFEGRMRYPDPDPSRVDGGASTLGRQG